MFEIIKSIDAGDEVSVIYSNDDEPIAIGYLQQLAMNNMQIAPHDFYYYEKGNCLEVGNAFYQLRAK